ncbi:uncharacterized protein F4812DRAFT_463839 [Daldinia caldariorum]|uniref:uncharacterized protein n=1 Tax=Daldinia caldariorum TaxID=326644 RepID=UPI0020080475|nr:uncharacterized protein F4812DRAFT_463839 [Daldinia caldariorum]KAI1463304.1 hypothetical protein F4812DRAFT_463839 [Daldinia caldariorum]
MKAFTSTFRQSGSRLITSCGMTSPLSLNPSPLAKLRTIPKTPRPSQQRHTSWIAWEQPDPALYSPPHVPLSTASRKGVSDPAAQYPCNIVEQNTTTTTTTETVAVVVAGADSREISPSDTIASSPIPEYTSPSPVPVPQTYHQKRSMQMHTESPARPLPPTTLLRILGETATWPSDKPELPHQPRVRKSFACARESSESRRGEAAQRRLRTRDVQERRGASEKSDYLR